MPDRFPETWATVAKGDYIESQQDGTVWKVTHEVGKADGRYLGITNAAGERRRLGPEVANQPVVRLVYGDVTEEEAVATVQAILGGEVIHPGRPELVATGMLRAHLVRFHEIMGARDPNLSDDDLKDMHIEDHAHPDNADIHIHRED